MASKGFVLRFESNYHLVKIVEGVKVLQFNARPNSALPEYAKTSVAYISMNADGAMTHLRIYKDHYPILEIDLGHPHHHGLKDGEIHVHRYCKGPDGYPRRSRKSRRLLDSEKQKYGKILEQMKESMK